MHDILKDHRGLIGHIQQIAGERIAKKLRYPLGAKELAEASAVLFLLGFASADDGLPPEPSLILNKRSAKVRQSGDLCCPGGGVMPGVDALFARGMTLPGLPMWHWPYWAKLRQREPDQARALRILFFTSLRESVEEMRLNPFAVRFMGPLPPQQLVMFRKTIYPMMGWISGQKRFFPNWEVEKIVPIPLKSLLDPGNYVRYQLFLQARDINNRQAPLYDAYGYMHKNCRETEMLWGATCKITLKFLQLMFDFTPPELAALPVKEAVMDREYANSA